MPLQIPAIIFLLLTLLVTNTGCGTTNKEIIDGARGPTEEVEPVTQAMMDRCIDSGDLNALFWHMWLHIGECADERGEYDTALKVFQAGKGSCVGHSLVYEYACNRMLIDCKVITIYGPNDYAHTICITELGVWYSMHERVYLKTAKWDDIEAVVKEVNPDATGYDYYHDAIYIPLPVK